ncbi:MAG: CHASE2 domain-containing protein [Leptolyngbyaceae cyanobacterium]
MSFDPILDYQYQPGGSLLPESPTYVMRQADQILYEALLSGEYCYVLNARQMGKSSLRIRAMERLRQQGITCTEIELSGIGSQQITANQWYGGLIQELVSGFGLSFQRRSWIQEREDLSPVQRLSQFIETVLLTQVDTAIVIFIDEIDSVLGLSFPTDEFFAFIRNCYEKRSTQVDYKRLTFVLLGVATPSDLIRSRQYSTPFNIGQAILLQGFELKNCDPLIQGLRGKFTAPRAALEEILYWSGGQPFLTQKLCWIVTQYTDDILDDNHEYIGDQSDILEHLVDSTGATQARNIVATLVNTHVIQNWEALDEPEHLRTIRDRLLRESRINKRVLELYRQILEQGSIPTRDNPEYLHLRLTGIVDSFQGQLQVKNPIYSVIFDNAWVQQELNVLQSSSQMSPMTATIVFSEVESFTAQMAEDEHHTLALVQRDMTILHQQCQQFDGTVIQALGNGVMMLFETAEKAVRCSIEIQKLLANAATTLPDSDILHHRIGIYTGEVLSDGNNVMGLAVTLAARLHDHAPSGGICLSQNTFDIVKRHIVTEMVDLGERPIKGLPEPLKLYEISPHRPIATPKKQRWHQLLVAVAIGIVMTGGMTGVGRLGILESWELQAFDWLMRLRPAEAPDDRFLLVTVTEEDVQSQPIEVRGEASLSDLALAQLLEKLEQGQPRVIGLDVYRQRQVDPTYPQLAEKLMNSDRLFTICHYGHPGVTPPPEIPPYRHGFNNVVQDADGVLRRQLLAVTDASPCQNHYALNWWLALQYLYDEGVELGSHPTDLKIDTVLLKRIRANMGGYNNIDAQGHQILLNYRSTPHIAETVTLNQVLSPQFELDRIADRIILIGVVAPSFNDHDWFTPYSRGWHNPRRMTGVELQAHMASQIISAVLDDRPLLWGWSESVEILWIGGWTVMASVVAMTLRSRRYLMPIVGGMVILLGGTCWVGLCFAGWIPFIPAAMGMVGGGMAVNLYRGAIAARRVKRSHQGS